MTSDKVEQLSRDQYRALSAKPRRSKFGAVRTTLDGITFASKLEAARWGQLKLLEQAGEIRDLRRQVRHRFEVAGHHVCDYVSDFDYLTSTGLPVTEDCKGGPLTAAFRVKARLFRALRGREIQIVRAR